MSLILGLTVRHPWPVALAWLGKDIENRRWHPSSKGGKVGMYLALHGGSTPVSDYREDFDDDRDWVMQLVADRAGQLRPNFAQRLTGTERDHWEDTLSTGQDSAWVQPGIIAVTRLKAVVRNSNSPWAAQGQFHWVLGDTVRLPQAVKPEPGIKKDLWELNENTLAEVRWAYALARKKAS